MRLDKKKRKRRQSRRSLPTDTPQIESLGVAELVDIDGTTVLGSRPIRLDKWPDATHHLLGYVNDAEALQAALPISCHTAGAVGMVRIKGPDLRVRWKYLVSPQAATTDCVVALG